MEEFTPESMKQARQLYEEAIKLEPENAAAYNLMAWTHLQTVFLGGSKFPPKDFEKAFELAQKAISLNDSFGNPHCVLSWVYYLLYRQYDKAVSEMQQAVSLNPNDAEVRANASYLAHHMGKREEAIKQAKQAIRLNPFPHAWYFHALGAALCLAGNYEEAIDAYKKALHLNPKLGYSVTGLAVAYYLSGREEEAKAMADEIVLLNPRFSVKQFEMVGIYKNRADTALLADTYRKIGLPD